MNSCTWVDVVTRNGPFDYMDNTTCRDPTYVRNVTASVDRWISNGFDVALFHFHDFSTSVVPLQHVSQNPSLKKALSEAKDNVEQLMISAFREDKQRLGELFFEHLRILIKLENI